MPNQKEAGKAFEYAILNSAFSIISENTKVNVVENSSYVIAKECFNLYDSSIKNQYNLAANSAINHIISLEPILQHSINKSDVLEIQLAADNFGIKGDVRDVLFIRLNQKWEIGISAKNNHRAVKHSRLSDKLDFGQEWFGLKCNKRYFNNINPIFEELRILKEKDKFWRDLINKADRFYLPILKNFKEELLELDKFYPDIVPSKLLKYLIGNKDYYKVIKRNKKTEIYGFNFYGTLNKSINYLKPIFRVSQLKLPKRIIEFDFKNSSKDTLILICDEGWAISFRIHNASSLVEPSLKFDINIIGQPPNLYSHHISW